MEMLERNRMPVSKSRELLLNVFHSKGGLPTLFAANAYTIASAIAKPRAHTSEFTKKGMGKLRLKLNIHRDGHTSAAQIQRIHVLVRQRQQDAVRFCASPT